jgi:flagellar hook assembly protein FlgD
VKITIADSAGNDVRTLTGPGESGLNRVDWDMTGARRQPVAPGTYVVTLQAGEMKLTQRAIVAPDR